MDDKKMYYRFLIIKLAIRLGWKSLENPFEENLIDLLRAKKERPRKARNLIKF